MLRNNRKLKDIPPDVRLSLEFLDEVLEEYAAEAEGAEHRTERSFEVMPPEVRTSLEILDSVIEEVEQEANTSRKPILRDNGTHARRKRHEEIRHSLEVLDNVLAEFDDCWESTSLDRMQPWDSSHKIFSSEDNSNGDQCDVKNGSPSQEQPPPIPKRSPATRLSELNLNPSDDTSLDSYDSNRSDSDVLSDPAQISSLSRQKSGDTAQTHDSCANCGRERSSLVMEPTDIPSPFQQRKLVFEKKIDEELSGSTGVNFRVRKTQISELSEPVSLPNSLSRLSSNQGDENEISLSNTRHTVKCTCREKIKKLNAKFMETRRLLKQNSINGLDSKPPSFVPPPPPILNGNIAQFNSMPHSDISVDLPLKMNGAFLLQVKDSFLESEMDSSVNSSNESLQSENRRIKDSLDSSQWTDSSRLCNRCSLSTTIEDLPHLLPTDALNRPQLGLSYSLEDDLSPGVKDIQQSSTPRSDTSNLSLFKTQNSSLSTFSHSASSLGYVSSQSDLELNNFPNKVPVSTFKSRTLPNGLDRSPFYSAVDEVLDRSGEGKDHNGNRYLKSGHVSHENLLQRRSCSAPPLPEDEKPKKKLFRFSRKEKKKNDDSLSLKSDLSFEEGISLKKVGALDGSTVLRDSGKNESGSEKKTRRLWSSFVGKK